VAPTFSISADFPITKKAGQACPHLQPDLRCGIHPRLRQQGFRGCAIYDCFGAGQKVSQITFAGRDWRQAQTSAKQMFEVFAIMRTLHELLWYLTEALRMPSAHPLYEELRRGANLRGAYLIGADLSEADLRLADLLGADFRDADLRGTDLTSSLFLIQSQLDAAKGDRDTKLPPSLTRPKQW
jgi:uncharacterized protein YjbI with pentapeptide repeats